MSTGITMGTYMSLPASDDSVEAAMPSDTTGSTHLCTIPIAGPTPNDSEEAAYFIVSPKRPIQPGQSAMGQIIVHQFYVLVHYCGISSVVSLDGLRRMLPAAS